VSYLVRCEIGFKCISSQLIAVHLLEDDSVQLLWRP